MAGLMKIVPRLCRRQLCEKRSLVKSGNGVFGNSSSSSSSSSFGYHHARYLSNSPPAGSKDDKKDSPAPALVDSSLRGVGQVIFLNSPTSGFILLGGLALGDPYLSVLAATGAVTATAAAKGAGLNESALKDGLWGYNGCLVGCAAAVFVNPLPAATAATTMTMVSAATAGLSTTVVGAAATPFVAAAMKPALGSMPQWTFAFNIVTLSTLLRTRPLLPTTTTIAPDTTDTVVSSTGFADVFLHAPFQGISQIFVVESSLAGAVVLGGIAYYSRGLAVHALVGSSVGAVTGLVLGADLAACQMGLWGFNSALTSLGVGVFFVHSPQTMALSAGGAAATAALFGAMSTVFGSFGSPCLTLPFCIAMSGCYLLHDTMPGLRIAQAPHSPEQNR